MFHFVFTNQAAMNGVKNVLAHLVAFPPGWSPQMDCWVTVQLSLTSLCDTAIFQNDCSNLHAVFGAMHPHQNSTFIDISFFANLMKLYFNVVFQYQFDS